MDYGGASSGMSSTELLFVLLLCVCVSARVCMSL